MGDAGLPRSVTGWDDVEIDGADAEDLHRVLDRPEVRMAIAFGSRVDGTPLEWSDLDIAVRFADTVDRDERFRLLDALTADLEAVSEVPSVDLVGLDRIGPHRAYQALRTGGGLLVGEDSERVEAEASYLVRKLDFDHVRGRWQQGLKERIEGGEYGRT